MAYVGKANGGQYKPFIFGSGTGLMAGDVEISDEVFIIAREIAEAYKQSLVAPPSLAPATPSGITYPAQPSAPELSPIKETPTSSPVQASLALPPEQPLARLRWTGVISSQKWMNFYSKVLIKFVSGAGLKLTLNFEIAPPDGLTSQKVEEVKQSLRELGLGDNVETS